MEITVDKLRSLLTEAYKCGYHGSMENAEYDVERLIDDLKPKKDDYRIWSVKELQQMPKGTIFDHMIKGRCWIVVMNNNIKKMQFIKEQNAAFLKTDGVDPWDKPMRLVFRPME